MLGKLLQFCSVGKNVPIIELMRKPKEIGESKMRDKLVKKSKAKTKKKSAFSTRTIIKEEGIKRGSLLRKLKS